MRLPRLRFTIRSMMVAVVLASTVPLVIVIRRDRDAWALELRRAENSYEIARLIRESQEIAVVNRALSFGRHDLDMVAGALGLVGSEFAKPLADFAKANSDAFKAKSEFVAATQRGDQIVIGRAKVTARRAEQNMLDAGKRINTRFVEWTADVQKSKVDELAAKADLERVRAVRNRFVW
jgi:hypothetical protein